MNGFKASTIRKLLKKKIDEVCESITDPDIKTIFKRDAIVSGGAIASFLQGDQPNDYDIYFSNIETTERVAKYYVDKFNEAVGKLTTAPGVKDYVPVVRREKRVNIKGNEEERVVIFMKSAGVAGESQEVYDYFEGRADEITDDFVASLTEGATVMGNTPDVFQAVSAIKEELREAKEKLPYRPIFLSDNAITLANRVQLVIRFYGSPADIHVNYDYAHAMCYYEAGEGKLTLPSEALQAILSKTLIYKGSLYPVASIFRVRKFLKRGWNISAGELLKIMFQLSKIDLSNHIVLRDQLIGVDAAYMNQLVNLIKANDGKVDQAYLVKIIDEVFE